LTAAARGGLLVSLAGASIPGRAGRKADAHGVAPGHEPVAVVLDLMQPSGARRRLGDLNGEAGLDEADRQGYADALT